MVDGTYRSRCCRSRRPRSVASLIPSAGKVQDCAAPPGSHWRRRAQCVATPSQTQARSNHVQKPSRPSSFPRPPSLNPNQLQRSVPRPAIILCLPPDIKPDANHHTHALHNHRTPRGSQKPTPPPHPQRCTIAMHENRR